MGRSDTDLNQRLHEHMPKYKRFQFGYFATAQEAYEKECALYHDFNPPAALATQRGRMAPSCAARAAIPRDRTSSDIGAPANPMCVLD